ncbi:MAG TPA: radical SAM protein, partial [Longimicrobium sp.]|nr:radical SAM protein [Longimicrobium sp.]
FLRTNPAVDVAVHGEGEAVFLGILERVETRDWSGLPSISYLADDGGYVQSPRAPRIAALEQVPSPYLTGVFEPLFRAYPDSVWFTMLETNRGCPFSCTYCDWGSAVATKVRQFDMDRVRREVDWLSEKQVEYVFCCDANFGMFPRDLEIARHVGTRRRDSGYPIVFATQATKNATERSYAVQMAMAEDGVQGAVTISYQSMDPHTLKLVKRQNISLASFSDLHARYVRAGIPTYTDMILGLPGETYESYTRGLETVIAGGQHSRIAFYDCALLPNAEMASPESRAVHGLLTVPQRIIETHSPVVPALAEEDDVPEFLECVVGTNSMPPEDWRRAKVHVWWLELLYFDRLFQVPMVIAAAEYGVSSRAMVEVVMGADEALFPTITGITARFTDRARRVSDGEPQLSRTDTEPNVWWPVDQVELIDLLRNWKLETLYRELEELLGSHLQTVAEAFRPALWASAVELNRRLLVRPFYFVDLEWEVDEDVWAYYLDIISMRPATLRPVKTRYQVIRTHPSFRSLTDWCEYLILCQNHKEGYIYPLVSTPLVAGEGEAPTVHEPPRIRMPLPILMKEEVHGAA